MIESCERGQRAVILGASMGGLLAARVLADYYRDVTVVERDVLPSAPVHRRGVPHGKQVHAIAARGTQILDELFPNFLLELRAGGAVSWDDGDFSKLSISIGGHQMISSGSSPSALSMSIVFVSRPSSNEMFGAGYGLSRTSLSSRTMMWSA